MFHHNQKFHRDSLRWARRMAEEGARMFGTPDPHHAGGEDEHRRRHGGGRHGGGDRADKRGRESRVFDHGDLRLVILGLLAETPRYGYDIIKVLEERIGGGYSPSPGVVYPTLTLLEEIGHATISEERAGRKLYTLTPEGTAFLEAQRRSLDAILARVAEGRATRHGPPPQIERAMENLITAVRLRLKGREPTDEQIRAVAAALDAAARTIEDI